MSEGSLVTRMILGPIMLLVRVQCKPGGLRDGSCLQHDGFERLLCCNQPFSMQGLALVFSSTLSHSAKTSSVGKVLLYCSTSQDCGDDNSRKSVCGTR